MCQAKVGEQKECLECRLTVDMEASGSPVGQSQLVLTVSDEVQLDSISLAFSEGESQDAMNETLPYPQALASKSATLDPSQTLKVLSGPTSMTIGLHHYAGCHFTGPRVCHCNLQLHWCNTWAAHRCTLADQPLLTLIVSFMG